SFARPIARRRAPRLLPIIEDLSAQYAMGRIGPSYVEQGCVNRIQRASTHDPFFVERMSSRLSRGQETCAERGAIRPQGNCGDQSAPISDAAGSYQRHVRKRISHLGDQSQCGYLATHVAASFKALRHDYVNTRISGTLSFFDCTALPDNPRSGDTQFPNRV